MQTVTEVLDAYIQALDQHDSPLAMKTLACLEGVQFRNESDWEQILGFCRQHNFVARLEIMTRSLIKSGNFTSYRPYLVLAELLVKSGRKKEARVLADEYKNIGSKIPPSKWELVSLLYSVEDFSGCLHEAREVIKESKDAFPFLIMEAKALWMLNENKIVKQNLKALSLLAYEHPGYLLWYAYVTMELGERDLLRTALVRLMELISKGSAKLTEGALHLLQQAGYLLEIQSLVRAADPRYYESPTELVYVYELAKFHGAYATALRFGAAILVAEPDHCKRCSVAL